MRFSIILLLICGFYTLKAQENRPNQGFKATIIGGINLSQLDEDGLTGFKKAGLRTGFAIERDLSISKGLSIGILYEERGSSGKLGIIHENAQISLKYISIPLSYYIGSWWFESLNRHKLKFAISFIPARLMQSSSSHPVFEESTGSFKRWDFSVALQFSYAVGMRGSIQFVLNRSINKSFESNLDVTTLQHYQLSMQIGYVLNELK